MRSLPMPSTRVGDLDIVWDIAGPSDGEPLLMINGLGAARQGWALQVPTLAQRYRVVTFDNRDVGETGAGSDPRPYGIVRFANDAIGLVESLELGPVHVIGASMGGAIAQELALTRPDLVRSLQIVCSWARTDPWLAELVRQWKEIYAALGPIAWARNTWLWVFTYRWYQDQTRLEELLQDTAAYLFPQSPDMFDRQCDAVLAFDTLPRLGPIEAPTHVVAGAEDLLTPLRFSQEIAAAIPGAHLTVLPNVGHGMFWERTEAFNAALARFLTELGE
jgi:3-oxoadipate enol-lactonase